MKDKVTLLLGDFEFKEEPHECNILRLDYVVELEKDIVENVGELLISEGSFESYLIPELYKGLIHFYNESIINHRKNTKRINS